MTLMDELNPGAHDRTDSGRHTWRRLGMALAVVFVSILGSVAPVGATGGTARETAPPTDAFVVALHEDGSARVSLTFTFDLQTDADRAGFEAIRDHPENLTTTFHDRFVRLAEQTSAATGREMAVSQPTIDVRTIDDRTGVVDLAITWDGLATRSDDGLVLTEPFADGFALDRPVVVRAPDGYVLADSTPTPDAVASTEATWRADSSLNDFRAVFEPRRPSSTVFGLDPILVTIGVVGLALLLAAAVFGGR